MTFYVVGCDSTKGSSVESATTKAGHIRNNFMFQHYWRIFLGKRPPCRDVTMSVPTREDVKFVKAMNGIIREQCYNQGE
jgi:hypothetical protein